MDILNSDTLYEALKMCDGYPNTQIGIAFQSYGALNEFVRGIETEVVQGGLIEWYLYKSYGASYLERKFSRDKASRIYLFDINSPSSYLGKSFHWVLHDFHIDGDAICRLESLERLVLPGIDIDEGNEELDEFINGFKIVERK